MSLPSSTFTTYYQYANISLHIQLQSALPRQEFRLRCTSETGKLGIDPCASHKSLPTFPPIRPFVYEFLILCVVLPFATILSIRNFEVEIGLRRVGILHKQLKQVCLLPSLDTLDAPCNIQCSSKWRERRTSRERQQISDLDCTAV